MSEERETHDFDIVASEIVAFVNCAVLTLAHRGTAQIVVQNETSTALVVAGPALLDGVGNAHVCSGIKGKMAVHDLETGRVHRGRSMKGDSDDLEGGLARQRGIVVVSPGLVEEGETKVELERERWNYGMISLYRT